MHCVVGEMWRDISPNNIDGEGEEDDELARTHRIYSDILVPFRTYSALAVWCNRANTMRGIYASHTYIYILTHSNARCSHT